MNESNEITRVWHKGPPPHIGWWNASICEYFCAWRFYKGDGRWSGVAYERMSAKEAGKIAGTRNMAKGVRWTDYWPENARVPRVKP
jgi:hypothetical protein